MSQDAALETAQNLRAALKSWGYKPELEKSKYAYVIYFIVPEKDKRTVISVVERLWKGVEVIPMDRKLHLTGAKWTMAARIPKKTTTKKRSTKRASTKRASTKRASTKRASTKRASTKRASTKRASKPKTTTKRKTVNRKKKSVSVKKLMKCIFSSS